MAKARGGRFLTVRSFDPCLPCGVHMSLGRGKTLQKRHSPTGVDNPDE